MALNNNNKNNNKECIQHSISSRNDCSSAKRKEKSRGRPKNWAAQNVDLSRDRNVKPSKCRKAKGSDHQWCRDVKQHRLRIQTGSEPTLDLRGFTEFIESKVGDSKLQFCVNFLEITSLLVYDIMHATRLMDVAVACAHTYKHITGSVLASTNFLETVWSVIGAQPQDGRENIDSFGDMLQSWSQVKSSPLIQKITDVLMYGSLLGLYTGPIKVDPKKFGALKKQFKEQKLMCTAGFIEYILTLFHFICDRGYTVFCENGSIKEVFMDNTNYDKWYVEATEHLSSKKNYDSFATHGIDPHSFLQRTRLLYNQGKEMEKYACDLNHSSRMYIKKVIEDLKRTENDILAREASQKTRQVPFTIVLEGHSGVGKSVVARALHTFFGKLFNKPLTGLEQFVHNATSSFWDGFTSDQWSVLIDDAGMWKPDIAVQDESISDIIRIVNNIPYIPNKAALEDKGKTPLMAELVILTTNSPELNFGSYFNYPYAAARRLKYHIRIEPKHINNVVSLDTSFCDNDVTKYPDEWEFQVFEPKPIKFGDKTSGGLKMMSAKLTLVKKCKNMGELQSFIGMEAYHHRQHQQTMINRVDKMVDIPICTKCIRSMDNCICTPEPQVLEAIQFSIKDVIIYHMVGWFFRLLCCICHDMAISFQMRYFARSVRLRITQLQTDVKETLQNANVVRPTQYCIALTLIIGSLITFYKLYNRIHLQGASIFKSFENKNERENFWKDDTIKLSTFDSSKKSLSLAGYHLDKQIEYLRKSTAYFRFNDGKRVCRGINIKGQKFVLPYHCLPQLPAKCQVIRGHSGTNFTDSHTFFVDVPDVLSFKAKDVAVVTVRSLPPGKDITDLFYRSKCQSMVGPAYYVSTNKDRSLYYKDIPFCAYKLGFKIPALDIVVDQWQSPSVITNDGDCGAMLCRTSSMGLQILGMHETSHMEGCFTKVAGSIPLDYEFIRSVIDDDDISLVQPQLGIPERCNDKLHEVHESSIIRGIEEANANLYGTISIRTYMRSKVQETILCDDMLSLGHTLDYAPPEMKSRKPWKYNLARQIKGDCPMLNSDLQTITTQMLKEWLHLLPDSEKEDIRLLDMKTVINGRPGVKYIDSINRNSSAGFPFNTTKRKYIIDLDPDDIYSEPIKFTDDIMDRYYKRYEDAISGNRTFPVYKACLKDEALPHHKVEIGKTRVFMGAPLDFTLLMRTALLSFVRVVQKNKFIFESAPGTEAQCIEWHHLNTYVTELGRDRIICGDFSGFDVTMRANVLKYAFELIKDFHIACGACKEHIALIRSIMYDVMFPVVDYNGELIEFLGKNPSGQALTVIINCIVNCIYKRYCYLKLNPDLEVSSFRRNVRLITYGDDDIMGVSCNIAWFNHTSIQKCLGDVGITYTMADKLSGSRPYISIGEADFLKRKFRYDPDIGTVVCPLALDSIFKALMIGIKSRAITKEQHAAQIIDAQLSEFFWHGKKMFNRWRNIFSIMVAKHQLEKYLPQEGLLTWHDYYERYWDNSQYHINSKPRKVNIQCGREENYKSYDNEDFEKCVFCGVLSATHTTFYEFFTCYACWESIIFPLNYWERLEFVRELREVRRH